MLLQLRDYIARERSVSVTQLTRALRIEPSALQPMLDCWVARGVIALHQQACQRTCGGCVTATYYQYVANEVM